MFKCHIRLILDVAVRIYLLFYYNNYDIDYSPDLAGNVTTGTPQSDGDSECRIDLTPQIPMFTSTAYSADGGGTRPREAN
jgi:hypothetical protein